MLKLSYREVVVNKMSNGLNELNSVGKTRNMVLCGLFTVLIIAGAFIKIPVPVVPFTLQFLFTMLAGLLLGAKWGAVSVALYTVLGLMGLPVFAAGGGIWYVLNPSFGYILAFIVGSYVTGRMVEGLQGFSWGRVLMANFTGLAIVYAGGMVYYYFICNFVIDTPIALWPLFLYCFLLAVPGDIVLCFAGAYLYKRLFNIVNR